MNIIMDGNTYKVFNVGKPANSFVPMCIGLDAPTISVMIPSEWWYSKSTKNVFTQGHKFQKEVRHD